MQHENWSCPKCSQKEYEIGEMRVTGSFWTKIFNIQNKKYSSVSCEKCSYTEFYKGQPSSGLENVFDFFTTSTFSPPPTLFTKYQALQTGRL